VFRGVALLATLGSLLVATKMFLGYEAAEAGVGGYKFIEKARGFRRSGSTTSSVSMASTSG
jgi:hypothetical protein